MDRPVHVCPGPAAGCDPAASGSEFRYGPAGSRYLQQIRPAEAKYGPKTVYYVDKDFELWVWAPSATLPSGAVEERSYLSGSVVAYRRDAGPRELRYQSVDRLGSIELVTKDDAAASVDSLDLHGYDAFGKPRGEAWTSSGERLHSAGDLGAASDRGFTGHEHLDAHYLIHMNGRVYDYRLGRFLSVDPIISDPASSQAINPYSYIGNNPLSGTDPSGYIATSTLGGGRFEVIYYGNGAVEGDKQDVSINGAAPQGTRIPSANPAEAQNPQQVAQEDTAKADSDSLDGVLLAAAGARGGGRGTRSGGPKAGQAEQGVLEPVFPRQTRLETEFEQLRRETETLTGKRIDVVGETTPRAVEWMRTVRDAARAEAAQAARTARTPTDRLVQHTSTSDLVGAAREARTGVPHGGQHLKEVREAAVGLRIRIEQINNGLTNPNLRSSRRVELEQELSKASKALDAAEQAIQGHYPRHSQ